MVTQGTTVAGRVSSLFIYNIVSQINTPHNKYTIYRSGAGKESIRHTDPVLFYNNACRATFIPRVKEPMVHIKLIAATKRLRKHPRNDAKWLHAAA